MRTEKKPNITNTYVGRTKVGDNHLHCTEIHCLRSTLNFYSVIKTDNGDEVDFGLCLLCAAKKADAQVDSCTISMEVWDEN